MDTLYLQKIKLMIRQSLILTQRLKVSIFVANKVQSGAFQPACDPSAKEFLIRYPFIPVLLNLAMACAQFRSNYFWKVEVFCAIKRKNMYIQNEDFFWSF